MATLKPMVEAIWRQLDLPPPLEEIGRSYGFDLSDTPISMRLEPNGRTVVLRGMIGLLPKDRFRAQGVLAKLLRFGLGLMSINHACLEIPEVERLIDDGETPALEVYALARAQITDPTTGVAALREIVEWRGYGEPLLDSAGDRADFDGMNPTEFAPEESLVIFKP